MEQPPAALHEYEDQLYRGEFMCIYSLLQHLLAYSAADSVAVLTRSASTGWVVQQEVRDQVPKQDPVRSWRNLVASPVIGDVLDVMAPQLIGFERPRHRDWDYPIFTVRIWPRGEVFPPPADVSVVAFFYPQRIHTDPHMGTDIPILRAWHKLITVWFALSRYRPIGVGESQSVNLEDGSDDVGSSLSLAGRWPVPFRELVKLIEGGPIGSGSDSNTPKWGETCLKCFHLNASPDCSILDEKGKPYCERDGRSRMAVSAALIPLRSLRSEYGRMKPWKAGIKEYRRLLPVGRLFPEVLDPRHLEGKALTVAFLGKFWREWLAPTQREELFQTKEGGPAEQARLLARCANLAHFGMEDMPADDRVIEALLWAVSRYAHDTLGVNSRLEIASHLLQAARNEPALHTLKPYYRDHLFHAIEVCFLGHLLLDLEYVKGKPLVALFQHLLRLNSSREVLRAWYVAALLHDIGYGIDVLNSAADMMKFFEGSDSLSELAADVRKRIEDLSESLAKFFPPADAPIPPRAEAPIPDHGMVAAEHLQRLVNRVVDDQEAARVYKYSIEAIAAHNVHNRDVSFRKQPLAFLLILCDTIQEWNRPHLSFSIAPMEILASVMGGGFAETATVRGPLERVSVNLKKDGPKLRMENRRQLQFELNYAAGIHRNCGVINLWLESCSNLQRLNLDGLPFDIRLIYRTPPYRTDRGHVECQMYRLEEAAHETHMSFLYGWFPNKSSNKAVLYDSDRSGESLEIHLRELTREKRIKVGMDVVRERLAKWRRYNEDRDFVGDYAPISPGFPFRRKST